MRQDVNYGLWYDFRNPAQWRQDFEEFYRERLQQIREAEDKGFNSVWLTEHHFCDDGYTPSPLVVASAIAAQTRKMHLGTNLMLRRLALRTFRHIHALSLLGFSTSWPLP